MRIWCNYPLPEAAALLLRHGTARHDLTIYERDKSLPPERDAADEVPADAEVLFGQPDPSALLRGRGLALGAVDQRGLHPLRPPRTCAPLCARTAAR